MSLDQKKNKWRWFKPFLFIGIALFILVWTFILAIPIILSSSWARDYYLSSINSAIPGQLTIQKISFSWLGSQQIKGVSLKDPNQQEVVSIDNVSTSVSLFKLLNITGNIFSLQIKGLNAKIVRDPNGETNLQKALGQTPFSIPSSAPDTIQLFDVDGNIQIEGINAPLSIQLSGKTQEGSEKGFFTVDTLLTGFEPEKIQRLSVKAENLPTSLLDPFISRKSSRLIRAIPLAIGPRVNIDLLQEKQELGSSIKLQINSPNVQGAATLALTSKDLSLISPAQFELKVTPEFARFLSENNNIPLNDEARIQINIDRLKIPTQGIWYEEADLAFHVNASHLPADLLCEVVCLEQLTHAKLEALLGPLINIDATVEQKHLSGPFQVVLNGAKGTFQLDAQMNQGYVTLNQPFYAEVTASPELGESVLQEIVPLLDGLVAADDRLSLTIEPEGFAMPINAMDLAHIQIGKMVINLGNVYFSNQGQVANILSALRVSQNNPINVQFTPIYLSIQNGVVHVERFDMLTLHRYPIATWGHVDLPGDKIKMSIGLTGKSLQQALGVAMPSRHYMMVFPLRGRIGHASIDKSKVAAKLAALTAQIAGGPQGMVLGTVLGLATGAYDTEPIPPPTTNPLPWETEGDANVTNPEEQTQDQNSQEKGRRSKNPLKAIKREASSLLQALIK